MRILAVEDEHLIAQRIERLCREILGARLSAIAVQPSLESARAFLKEHPTDLLLLDLNLNGRDGFELLEEAVAGAFHTIIISACTDQAIHAFEYGVLDFIPKPFSKERLEAAFQRYENAQYRAAQPVKYLATRHQQRLQLHEVEEVLYIRAADHYAELCLRGGGTKLHDKPLNQLIKLLPPQFGRIHKSYIANMDEALVLHSQAGGRYHLEMSDGARIPVSRSKYPEIRQQFV